MKIGMICGQQHRDILAVIAGNLLLMAIVAALGWSIGIRLVEAVHFGWLLLSNIGLLTLLLAAAFGFGTGVVATLRLCERNKPEFGLFSLALGLGVMSHLMLGLGAVHLFYKGVAWAVVVAGTLLGLFEIVRHWTVYRSVLREIRLPRSVGWLSITLVLLLVVNCLYPLLCDVLLPPTAWDEVAYHLAIPKIYIRHHALTYIPFIPYSNWPLETEMLFTLCLLLPSETLTHLVSWASLLLTCWGLYLLGRRYFTRQVGLLAAVIYSATPMVGSLSGTALVELPLTLYTFLATFAFINWLNTHESSSWRLSALCGGLAASTKLNGALIPLILGILLIVASLARRPLQLKSIVIRFAAFGLLAFAVVAPWYIKSWLQTGNPFWPFLFPVLGGRNWDALGSEYLFGFIRLPNLPLTPANWLLGLWHLTIRSRQFGPPRITLGWHYLVLLPIALPALLFLKPVYRRVLRWLFLLGGIYYTAWFLQTHQARFLMPTLPVLTLLAASGAWCLWNVRRAIWRMLFQSGLVLFLVLTSWLASPDDRARLASRWPFLSGRIDSQTFLSTQVAGYSTYAYANEHLPLDAYVLLALYESRGYYLDRDYMWANPISQRALRLEQFANADDLADELRERGFTHIIFRSAKLDDYTYIRHGEYITGLMRALLAEKAYLVYTSSELELYELPP